MITISNAVRKIIKKYPFLEDSLANNIINCSELARKIKPEIEREVLKKVKEGAIVMALKRLSVKANIDDSVRKIFAGNPDMILRSNLTEFTFVNSDSLQEKHGQLLTELNIKKKHFITITQGIFETTVITNEDLKEKLTEIFKNEKIISRFNNLSSITIRLPKEAVPTPGVYYFVLKALAYERINIIEVVSTYSEFTIILADNEVNRALLILKDILSN